MFSFSVDMAASQTLTSLWSRSQQKMPSRTLSLRLFTQILLPSPSLTLVLVLGYFCMGAFPTLLSAPPALPWVYLLRRPHRCATVQPVSFSLTNHFLLHHLKKEVRDRLLPHCRPSPVTHRNSIKMHLMEHTGQKLGKLWATVLHFPKGRL